MWNLKPVANKQYNPKSRTFERIFIHYKTRFYQFKTYIAQKVDEPFVDKATKCTLQRMLLKRGLGNGEWGMRNSGQRQYPKNQVGARTARQRDEDYTWQAKDGR